jgi:hypothetical protein
MIKESDYRCPSCGAAYRFGDKQCAYCRTVRISIEKTPEKVERPIPSYSSEPYYAIAIGSNAVCNSYGSVAIGYSATTRGNGAK